MYEDTNWHDVIPNLKHFGLINRYIILISYVESTDEASRLILKIYHKKLIEFIL